MEDTILGTTETAKKALSPQQLARRWGKCRQTIYNMIADGELRTFRVRNSRLILMTEIQRIERGDHA